MYVICALDVGLDGDTMSGIIMVTASISGMLRGDSTCQQTSTTSAPRRKSSLEEGALNPAPGKVRDPKFQEGGFFDPRDAVQVKYEMLRRVSVEKAPVTEVSDEYGVSRPTYYRPRQISRRRALRDWRPRSEAPMVRTKSRARCWRFSRRGFLPASRSGRANWRRRSRRELGLDVHPRTIERAVGGKKTPK